jgi:serine/threonine-protein kinase ULK/ATG1
MNMLQSQSPSITIRKVGNDLKYRLTKPLGEGQYGEVYEGVFLQDSQNEVKVAVKKISAYVAYYREEEVLREIETLTKIHSDYVAKFYGVRRTVNNIYLITEMCEGGSLHEKIVKNGALPEKDMSNIQDPESSKIFTIFHRDLKPQNVMLHEGVVKIIDFGFSKTVKAKEAMNALKHSQTGTPYYSSPQLLDGESYSAKNDIFSAGVLFYEMLTGKKPWIAKDEFELFAKIKGEPLIRPQHLSEGTWDLLKMMLEVEEIDRSSWEEIWNSPALKNVTL